MFVNLRFKIFRKNASYAKNVYFQSGSETFINFSNFLRKDDIMHLSLLEINLVISFSGYISIYICFSLFRLWFPR